MRKFDKTEKMMIKLIDLDNYTAFDCPLHKLNLQRNDVITGECAYCKKQIPNINEELKKYKETL